MLRGASTAEKHQTSFAAAVPDAGGNTGASLAELALLAAA